MSQVLGYVLAAAAFVAIFAFLKRNPGWSRGEDGGPYSAPGWWRGPAVIWLAIVSLFVAYVCVEHGFHWGVLLVFPILGGAFALGAAMLSWIGRRA
jgi:hypothetical protein